MKNIFSNIILSIYQVN